MSVSPINAPGISASTRHAPVMIMAGGTGGHIFPGIAVAQELRARDVPVVWMGSVGGLETRLVPQAGLTIETLKIGGVRGKGLMALLAAPWRIARALLAAGRVFARVRPQSALALGGFASGPGGIAAWLRRVPLLVHEQNRVPGATNRILAHFSATLLCGFDGAFADATWVGNPVRREIAALDAPALRFATRNGPICLLVLGGSQGAQSLNAAVPNMLRDHPATASLQVRHQCGAKHLDQTRNNYRDAGVEADVAAFVDDMAAAYAWSDLVICRAGALTLAELAAAGVGSILVPYPNAVDDHQTQNAQAMVAADAALLIAEGEGFGTRLGAAFETTTDRSRLLQMAQNARTLAKPDAAARIADACMQVAA